MRSNFKTIHRQIDGLLRVRARSITAAFESLIRASEGLVGSAEGQNTQSKVHDRSAD